ncbi:conserved protein of unknown function [Tenacibaculum sp. 190524A05c]
MLLNQYNMRKVKNLLFIFCLTILFSNYTTPFNYDVFTNPDLKKGKVVFKSKLIGGDKHVGNLTIATKDRTNFLVTFKMKKGWTLEKSRVFIGDLSELPLKENGCPDLKSITYRKNHNSGVKEFSYIIPLGKIKKMNCLSILSKAVATKGNKKVNAWSEGEKLSCNNKITYSSLCKLSGKKKVLKSAKSSINNN